MSTIAFEAWVLKKPSKSKTEAWTDVRPQRRYVESRGFAVDYFAEARPKRKPSSKPRGSFDLRDVTMIRESADPTAPSTALDLCAKKHAFTLSFESHADRDAFLAIWVNAVPISSVPKPLAERFFDSSVGAALAGTEAVAIGKDGWMSAPTEGGGGGGDGEPGGVAVFVHTMGYQLSWYKERPADGDCPCRRRVEMCVPHRVQVPQAPGRVPRGGHARCGERGVIRVRRRRRARSAGRPR